MSDNMTSIKDFFNFEEMGPCSCGKDKAIYFCKKKECPNTQTYYCLLCSENPDLHDHANVRVITEIKACHEKWSTLKNEITDLTNKSTQIQEPFACLIRMCERLMISAPINKPFKFRSLSKDLEALTKICTDFQQTFN